MKISIIIPAYNAKSKSENVCYQHYNKISRTMNTKSS